jgi:hypothetical protein
MWESNVLESGADLRALSERAYRLLCSLAQARSVQGLSSEEISVFVAIGYLSIGYSGDFVALKPITYREVSKQLAVPKATVRRKAIRLLDKKLISTTGRGVVISDIPAWSSLIASIFHA